MKRALVIVLAAALALSMLAVLAGCGGDANKDEAKGLMQAGDNYMSEVDIALTELTEMQTELATTAMGGDMSAVTGEAGAAMTEEVMGILDTIAENLELAKAEYEKILALDGVQDYKDYANLMIDAVDIYLEQLDYTSELVVTLIDALEAMAQGQDIDILSMMMDSEELTMIEELGEQGDDIRTEAEQWKLDKNLEN